jgi:ribosomal protein L21E
MNMAHFVIFAVASYMGRKVKYMETYKVGDNVQYVGALMSTNKEYIRARTGRIVAINGNDATIKARDGSTFHCTVESLVKG